MIRMLEVPEGDRLYKSNAKLGKPKPTCESGFLLI